MMEYISLKIKENKYGIKERNIEGQNVKIEK